METEWSWDLRITAPVISIFSATKYSQYFIIQFTSARTPIVSQILQKIPC